MLLCTYMWFPMSISLSVMLSGQPDVVMLRMGSYGLRILAPIAIHIVSTKPRIPPNTAPCRKHMYCMYCVLQWLLAKPNCLPEKIYVPLFTRITVISGTYISPTLTLHPLVLGLRNNIKCDWPSSVAYYSAPLWVHYDVTSCTVTLYTGRSGSRALTNQLAQGKNAPRMNIPSNGPPEPEIKEIAAWKQK